MSGKMSKTKVKLSGKQFFFMTITNGSSSATFNVYPAGMSTRLINLGKVFEFYRFTRLKFAVLPSTRYETTWPSTSAAQVFAFAWEPETAVATSTSITFQQASQNQCSLVSTMSICNTNTSASGGTGVLAAVGETRVRFLTVPKSVLLGVPNKWYRCAPISGSDTDYIQGSVIAAVSDTGGANGVVIECGLEWEAEFTGAEDFADVQLRIPKQVEEKKEDPEEDAVMVFKQLMKTKK